jgi:two-component system, LytTR family, response regulator
MLRALLIDDEPDARADLRISLEAHVASLIIVGEAETLSEARTQLARGDYDLVFLDVQLRGGTGFDLVEHIRPEARIVFVTAHDRYALRAFEVNALDYLLKPIAPERLAASLVRVLAALVPAARELEAASDDVTGVPLQPGDVVYLRTGSRGRFTPLRQISAIEADQNYSTAQLADGSRMLLRRTLKSWEDILPATHFMRVHRTAIVNLERVVRYERDREEHTILHLEGLKEPIAAVRKQWPELQEKLSRLRRVV